MGVELRQETNQASPSAGFVEDRFQARVAHLPANARIKTTWIGQITATSPGAITGLGGDTSLGIPGGAVPTDLRFFSPVAASTGATITIGLDTTSTYFLNALSVNALANGQGQQLPANPSNLFAALAALPIGSVHTMSGFFAQTATALGAGPYYIELDYYLPNPA